MREEDEKIFPAGVIQHNRKIDRQHNPPRSSLLAKAAQVSILS